MTESLYAGWLEQYRKAWIDRNATAAGALFTKDGVYRDHAFQAPHVGRAQRRAAHLGRRVPPDVCRRRAVPRIA
jgi:hypothetical protein